MTRKADMEEKVTTIKSLDEEMFLKLNEMCIYGISEPEVTLRYLCTLNAQISSQISRFLE